MKSRMLISAISTKFLILSLLALAIMNFRVKFKLPLKSKYYSVIPDASIKKNIATSILHIHSSWNVLTKIIHYAINVTFTEVELFSIRCGINQAVQVQNTENIIVITDAIHAVRWIFNLSFHSYQPHLIAISQDLRAFFNRSSSSSITFWDCSSSAKCCPHLVVDQETKQFNIEPSFPCKSSWDFSKKEECDSILQNW